MFSDIHAIIMRLSILPMWLNQEKIIVHIKKIDVGNIKLENVLSCLDLWLTFLGPKDSTLTLKHVAQ
jgi:hypothetical protein